eukprot:5538025-Prymnesium_polylepis.1
MDTEKPSSVTELFANGQLIGEDNDAALESYSTLMASQEYATLEEFPELNNVKLSDYVELDQIRSRHSTRRPWS